MGHHQVLFSGEIIEGAQGAQVRVNLSHRFGLDDRKVGQLFSGRTVVIESGLDSGPAFALQKELNDLGAVTRVKDLTPEERVDLQVDARDYKGDRPQADYTLNDITAAHIECPRCGHMQLDSQMCARCGIDITAASTQKRREDRAIGRKIDQLQDDGPALAAKARRQPKRDRLDAVKAVEVRTERRKQAPRRGLLRRLGFGRG